MQSRRTACRPPGVRAGVRLHASCHPDPRAVDLV